MSSVQKLLIRSLKCLCKKPSKFDVYCVLPADLSFGPAIFHKPRSHVGLVADIYTIQMCHFNAVSSYLKYRILGTHTRKPELSCLIIYAVSPVIRKIEKYSLCNMFWTLTGTLT